MWNSEITARKAGTVSTLEQKWHFGTLQKYKVIKTLQNMYTKFLFLYLSYGNNCMTFLLIIEFCPNV